MSATIEDTSGRRCLFCDSDGPLTREHIWPDWLGNAFPDLVQMTTHFSDTSKSDARSWRGTTFSQRSKLVCERCNSGWMSIAESEVKPVLSRMILGRTLKLGPQRQLILAMWAAKTAFVHVAASDVATAVPRDDPHAFYRLRRPLDQMTIWTGTRSPEPFPEDDESLLVFAGRIQPIVPRPEADQWVKDAFTTGAMYGVTLGVGKCALQVWGSNIPGLVVEDPADNRTAVRRIWPTTTRFQWPPQQSLDLTGGLASMPQAFLSPLLEKLG